MSDLLGLACIHGEDATTCSICWAPPVDALCMRCEHVHRSDAAYEERVRFGCLTDDEALRIFCAHADQNGEGAHWKNARDVCPLISSDDAARPAGDGGKKAQP